MHVHIYVVPQMKIYVVSRLAFCYSPVGVRLHILPDVEHVTGVKYLGTYFRMCFVLSSHVPYPKPTTVLVAGFLGMQCPTRADVPERRAQTPQSRDQPCLFFCPASLPCLFCCSAAVPLSTLMLYLSGIQLYCVLCMYEVRADHTGHHCV